MIGIPLHIYLANLIGATKFVPFPHLVSEYYDLASRTFVTSSGKELEPSLTNPLFIDDASGAAVRKPGSILQSKLDALINGTSKPGNVLNKNRDKISVALVKMKISKTDPKESDPEFAGWKENKPFYAASAAKIAALYAAFQLRNELNLRLLSSTGIDRIEMLKSGIHNFWKASGRMDGFPKISELFSLSPGSPGTVNFSTNVQTALAVFSQSNRKVSKLIRDIGFPYIASSMLASGLYSPSNSGIWLREDYAQPRTTFPPSLDPHPSPFLHNVTALAAARFFVLIEQRRLVSRRDALEMKNILSNYPGGCVISDDDTPWDQNIKAGKCGFESEDDPQWQNDAFIYVSNTNRYVMALLTKGVGDDYFAIRQAVQDIV